MTFESTFIKVQVSHRTFQMANNALREKEKVQLLRTCTAALRPDSGARSIILSKRRVVRLSIPSMNRLYDTRCFPRISFSASSFDGLIHLSSASIDQVRGCEMHPCYFGVREGFISSTHL